RLAASRDDLQGDAQDPARLLEKEVRTLGVAQGAGAEDLELGDAELVQERAVVAETVEGGAGVIGIESPRPGDILAEPRDRAALRDDAENSWIPGVSACARVVLDDGEQDGVRSDVDGGEAPHGQSPMVLRSSISRTSGSATSSTRRFLARPSSVELSATGSSEP